MNDFAHVINCHIITGPYLMSQYCFARWHLSSSSVVVVRNAAGALAGALAVGRPTLYGGPVRLRPVRTIPCYYCYNWNNCRRFYTPASIGVADDFWLSFVLLEIQDSLHTWSWSPSVQFGWCSMPAGGGATPTL